MAKFDTASIEGFDGMTAEQKVNALLGADIPEQIDLSKYVIKSQFDKTASELAETKRQLKGKMTETEQMEAERAEKAAAAQKELDDVKAKLDQANKLLAISTYKSSYLALGYDEKLAQDTAEALANGDTAKVFANQQKYKDALSKSIKEELMMGDPRPGSGNSGVNGQDSAVEFAKKLAKSESTGNQAAQDALKYYT